MADYDISEAFQKIEEEMIASMSRNLKRHLKKELDEGINYSMWQAEQLAALNNFRKNNEKAFKSYFSTVNKQIETILKMAYQSGAMDQEVQILEAIKRGWKVRDLPTTDILQGSFFKINERKLTALIEATKKDMAKAETAMLRMANDEYRKVIYNSEVYYNTGAGTLSQCVDMATKDFLSRGITCIEYANGARVAIDSYAQMALRTAQTRAYLTGEASKRDEWGVSTVIVNKRGVACPRCLQWVGRVFYDDVWGSAPIPSPAKYPLLSEAVAGGLYHPNCKDIHTTYFEDVNTPPEPMTEAQKKEAARVYDLEQKQRYNERMIRKYKRLSQGSVDPENVQKYEAKLSAWQEHQREFVKANGDVLKRRYENEKLRLPSVPEPPKTAGSTKVSETSDRPIVNKYGQTVVFDKRMDSEKWSESVAIIRDLADEYDTRLTTVGTGASGGAGDVNMGGAMRLSSTANDVAIHEFAHTMATEALTKYGVVDDSEFWKEVKSVRRAYRKDVGDDSIRWISSYEHSTTSIDEFFAEAFTQAKMDQMGMPLPNKYGNDLTYSKQVLEITDKYFKKKRGLSAKIGGAGLSRDTLDDIVDEAIDEKSAFVPAKTREEAEDFIRKYVDDKQFGALGVSYSGISVESANLVNETLSDLYETFNIEKLGGVYVAKGNTKLGKMLSGASAGYSPIRKSLLLNNNSLKNIDDIVKSHAEEIRLVQMYAKDPKSLVFKTKQAEDIFKVSLTSGRATVPDTIEDAINHEMGHHLERVLPNMDGYAEAMENMPKYSKKISGYATTSKGEYIAESFASYRKGEGIIDPALSKMFDSLRKDSSKAIAKYGKNDIIESTIEQLAKRSSKDFQTIFLPKKEYAQVMSELATNMSAAQRKQHIVKKAIGDHIYTVENNGFGNYRIIGKKPIDDIDIDIDN